MTERGPLGSRSPIAAGMREPWCRSSTCTTRRPRARPRGTSRGSRSSSSDRGRAAPSRSPSTTGRCVSTTSAPTAGRSCVARTRSPSAARRATSTSRSASCPSFRRVIPPFVDAAWLGEHRRRGRARRRALVPGRALGGGGVRSGTPPGRGVRRSRPLARRPGRPAARPPSAPRARGVRAWDERGRRRRRVAVVAYDDAGGVIAARLVWMLRATGHEAALLDGGIDAVAARESRTGDAAAGPRSPHARGRPIGWPASTISTHGVLARRA